MRFITDVTVELKEQTGTDAGVVECARVSMLGADTAPEEECHGLINYLMKHRHGTPFEHNSFTFRVHAPIFVWREWHRHRIGFSYNEESGRYKKLDPVFHIPRSDRPMMKIDNWKPGRPKFTVNSNREVEEKLINNLVNSYTQAYLAYERNLELGVDPSVARECLPVGIYSTCYVTCNARSLMSFLSLRTHDPDAKFVSYPVYEIEEAARKMEEIFSQCMPITYTSFVTNGRVSP